MLQIIKYEEQENDILVGFKKHSFAVYGMLGKVDGFTQRNYIQNIYEQCKSAIDYEEERYLQGKSNSIMTDEEGEEFIPDEPRPISIDLQLLTNYIQFEENQESVDVQLVVTVKDQYSDNMTTNVSIGTNFGTVDNNTLTIPKITDFTEINVIARASGVEDSKIIYAYPYTESKIVDEVVNDEQIAIAEAIIDFESRISILEGGK